MSAVVAADRADLTGQIKDKRLARLFGYWQARKDARRFPSRGDIDPLDFPYILGSVMLVDVLRPSLRFHVRLHGTEMVARAQYDLTGKLIDDLPISEYRDYVLERCRSLIASGEPFLARHNRVVDGFQRRYEALWLPLSDDGAAVTMLLCALIYDPLS